MTDSVTITIPREKAEEISAGLSDLLCWCRGFKAALGPDDREREPFGAWAAREANIKIKAALGKGEQ